MLAEYSFWLQGPLTESFRRMKVKEEQQQSSVFYFPTAQRERRNAHTNSGVGATRLPERSGPEVDAETTFMYGMRKNKVCPKRKLTLVPGLPIHPSSRIPRPPNHRVDTKHQHLVVNLACPGLLRPPGEWHLPEEQQEVVAAAPVLGDHVLVGLRGPGVVEFVEASQRYKSACNNTPYAETCGKSGATGWTRAWYGG